MRLSCRIIWALFTLPLASVAREFTVLVYNVENLFDVDGVAEFEDYRAAHENPRNPYTPARLWTKLQSITRTLEAVNSGKGPEVVLFQEFEIDRTPLGQPQDLRRMLPRWAGTTVETMLSSGFSREVADLPVEFLLLKHLEDRGLGGYAVVFPDPAKSEAFPAHRNVTFSRFPSEWVRQRPMADARDLLTVKIRVDGAPFYLLNNHWKSGASSRETEPTRRQNAHVVRAELEAILLEDRWADVLIGGDLNSNYNQSAVFPDWGGSGVNDVLGSQGDEGALLEPGGPLLYNLWSELPLAERGSEVFRGMWGTLMQMLITPGLYDGAGVQYVDNSFFRVILPGENVETEWQTPLAWINAGTGTGFSDHLAVGARFRAGGSGAPGEFPRLQRPTRETVLPAERPSAGFERLPAGSLRSARELASLGEGAFLAAFGQVFEVEGTVAPDGRGILVGDRRYGVFTPRSRAQDWWRSRQAGETVRFVGQQDEHRGEVQFVIQDEAWIRR